MGTEIIQKAAIVELCGARDRALASFGDALERIKAANAAAAMAAAPSKLVRYISRPALNLSLDHGRSNCGAEDYRKALDKAFWSHVMEVSGLGDIMGAKQKEEWRDALEKNPPAFTHETVVATFESMRANAGDIFRQSIVDVFERLSRSYKSHDGFKIGARIVQEYAVSTWSGKFSWRYSGHRDARDQLDDLDRAFHLLDGKQQAGKVSDAAGAAMREKATTFESDYFRLRWFRNGNLHVWMLRDDLVREANKMLAAHYGSRLAWQHLHPDERRKYEAA